MAGQKPEETFRAGSVKATVWANEVNNKDGKPTKMYSVKVTRSYKDKNDKWMETESFNQNDLPKVALVVAKAYEKLTLKEPAEE